MAVPVLNPYQLSYAGTTFGDGTSYDIVDIHGLEGLASVVSGDVQRLRDHGEWQGIDWSGPKDITLTLEVVASSDAAFRTALEAVFAAFTVQAADLPLYFSLPGMSPTSTRVVNCRPRQRPVIIDMNYVLHVATIAIQLHASDPRNYDATVQTLTTTLPTPNGGTAWPAVWPIAWGSSSGAGQMTVVNSGNFEAPGTFTIAGPVTNPTIENLTTGQNLAFLITLSAGDHLVVDLLARTVILNGTANRRGAMTTASQWFRFKPGSTLIGFIANTTIAGSTLSVSWQSAWL